MSGPEGLAAAKLADYGAPVAVFIEDRILATQAEASLLISEPVKRSTV